jgi:opacity protein-like surface antigen
MAVLAAMALAMPVMAADAPGYGVVVGGRISADAGWQIKSGDYSPQNNTEDTLVNFFTGVQGISYLRATFNSSDKTTGARIEIGMWGRANADNTGNDTENGLVLRLAYGWWKVGSCTLTIGQAWGRLGGGAEVGQNLGRTKRSSGDLQGYGFVGATRSPRIALAAAVNDFFGFDVSISQAGAERSANQLAFSPTGVPNQGVYIGDGSTQNYLPKLEVVLDFSFNGFKISPGAGIAYQKWEFDLGANNNDDSVLSYLLLLPVKYEQGPFYAVLSAFYGQNISTDWSGENSVSDGFFNSVANDFGGTRLALPSWGLNGEIEDTTIWGLGLGFGYSVTDKLTLKIGGGFSHLNNDAWELVAGGEDSFTRWAAFIGAPYQVTSNFIIQPEITYYNYGDVVGVRDIDAGSEWLLGVYFQFLF